MKKTTLFFVLCSLSISFFNAIASKEQELVIWNIPEDIMISGITPYFNLQGMAAIKRTCKQLNTACQYADINPHVIEEIDEVTCTKMLSHLAHTQQNKNFAYFFQHNNIEKRKEALKLLDWAEDSNNDQLMQAYCTGYNTALRPNWKNIFNDTIALTTICLSNNPNIQDQNGRTALIWASINRYTEIVKLLLSNPNTDVHTKNNHGDAAFFEAVLCCQSEKTINVVELFLSHPKIDINIQDNTGNTTFMLAFNNANEKRIRDRLTKLFFTHHQKIDVNHQNINGYTALMWAAANGKTDAVKELLSLPAINIHLQNKVGETARTLASKNKCTKVAELLESHSS